MSGKYKRQGSVREVYAVTNLGSGLEMKRRRKLEFDHSAAVHLLELEEFPGDRKLKQKHVDYLVRTMTRGTFHPEWVTLITCGLNGNSFRMNGQHTAWARLEMPEDWPCPVEMMEYEAGTESDMRQLYSSIDRASPRTKANVIESYLAGSEEFKMVKAQVLRVAPAGFAMWFWKTEHERNQFDGDDIAYLLKTDHFDLTMKVCSFLGRRSAREQKHIFRSSVVGAMYATFDKAPQIATSFWGPVADGTGIDERGDPRLKLRNELMQTAVAIGGGASSDKKKMSRELLIRLCIAAWNAFRERRSLQILRATERGKRPRVK